jgi:hypothetical protein
MDEGGTRSITHHRINITLRPAISNHIDPRMDMETTILMQFLWDGNHPRPESVVVHRHRRQIITHTITPLTIRMDGDKPPLGINLAIVAHLAMDIIRQTTTVEVEVEVVEDIKHAITTGGLCIWI